MSTAELLDDVSTSLDLAVADDRATYKAHIFAFAIAEAAAQAGCVQPPASLPDATAVLAVARKLGIGRAGLQADVGRATKFIIARSTVSQTPAWLAALEPEKADLNAFIAATDLLERNLPATIERRRTEQLHHMRELGNRFKQLRQDEIEAHETLRQFQRPGVDTRSGEISINDFVWE